MNPKGQGNPTQQKTKCEVKIGDSKRNEKAAETEKQNTPLPPTPTPEGRIREEFMVSGPTGLSNAVK